MLNILPHIYQKIGKWLIVLLVVIPSVLAIIKGFVDAASGGVRWTGNEIPNPDVVAQTDKLAYFFDGLMPDYLQNLLIAIGIILYFMSKDKIQDEYIDMLKLKSISLVFIISAIVGFLLHNVTTPLIFISLLQVFSYVIFLKLFKKYSA